MSLEWILLDRIGQLALANLVFMLAVFRWRRGFRYLAK
jgi:hypothetical protein